MKTISKTPFNSSIKEEFVSHGIPITSSLNPLRKYNQNNQKNPKLKKGDIITIKLISLDEKGSVYFGHNSKLYCIFKGIDCNFVVILSLH